MLDEERLGKPEAQEKIAALFLPLHPERPVIVIDASKLKQTDRYEYASVMQGPIRGIVKSARKQLKESRREIDDGATTVLFVVNNGFSALSHEELLGHVVNRAQNDTDEIDAVVVAGCYLHSDGFDTFAMWPMDYVPIQGRQPFREYEDLKAAWDKLANRHMTDFVTGRHGAKPAKEAQTDIVFDWGGHTFVKPATVLGVESDFYGPRRPRLNHLPFEQVKHVAYTVPLLSKKEFNRIKVALKDEPLLQDWETWSYHVEEALSRSTATKPVVPVGMSRGAWEAWKRRNPNFSGLNSLRDAANSRYGHEASRLVQSAQKFESGTVVTQECIVVLTELIGQDENNDLSRIGVWSGGDVNWIVVNVRTPHFGALALAAAHALRLGLDRIIWSHDLEYAWI